MNIKRLIPFALSLCLLLCFVFPSAEVSAATKAELEQKIESINSQINANKNKLNELKGKKEAQQAAAGLLLSKLRSGEIQHLEA